ncbi:M15 family metallopeptidase [Xylanimonas protaetiae]|uniref:D-alanyl-D-alanine carboxypeptidase-like core domain-containing protein n=1 Tax=Xylanimonas protaetiae TaxID=2509457 RepID=A0A4P6F7M3_9MICO|nr:M15 family metallopeptidase [Xylanimonas protaetiae]QAY69257.1 hypothetical protein ET471_03730 [Xylanimonas protaetiae]
MPQLQPTRASLRTSTRARRTPRFRAVTTGVVVVTAAALAATTLPTHQDARPAVRATATPGAQAVTVSSSDAAGAEIAPIDAAPEVVAAVGAAVAQASGALAAAEHVAAEGNGTPADQIAQIQQTTSVVRELVRRVSTTGEPAAASTAAAATTPVAAGVPASTTTTAAAPADAAATLGESAATDESSDAARATVAPEIGAAADAAVSAAGAASADAAEPQVVATALTQQTAVLTQLIDANPAAAIAVVPGPSPEEVAAQQAAEQQAAEAAHLAALAAEAMQYGNGQIPEHLLAPIPWSTTGSKLRADAAAALVRLNDAFRAAFGTDLGITDSYRSYADQVAVKQLRGRWAAVPGYSNHGFGVAVDLGTGVADFSSPQFAWMKANAPAYGWIHPDWAAPGGSKPEAWHWEFVG